MIQLLEHLQNSAPYDAIVGFSQGANFATILAGLAESGACPWLQIRSLVLICGVRFG